MHLTTDDKNTIYWCKGPFKIIFPKFKNDFKKKKVKFSMMFDNFFLINFGKSLNSTADFEKNGMNKFLKSNFKIIVLFNVIYYKNLKLSSFN